MKKKVEGRNYVILDDVSRFPYKVNKSATDKTIEKLERSLKEVIGNLKEVEAGKIENLSLLIGSNMTFVDIIEEIWKLEEMLESVQNIKAELAGEDADIPSKEELAMLNDYGFRDQDHGFSKDSGFWEKIIYDGDDKEVVEEVQWTSPDSKPLYRERTTIWKKTDKYSRSSDTITYKKLRMTKKLAKAIENTRGKKGSDDERY